MVALPGLPGLFDAPTMAMLDGYMKFFMAPAEFSVVLAAFSIFLGIFSPLG
jgi:hypothetical protein